MALFDHFNAGDGKQSYIGSAMVVFGVRSFERE